MLNLLNPANLASFKKKYSIEGNGIFLQGEFVK